MCFPGGATGKESTCQCRRCKSCGFNPRVGKIHGGGHGNPFQYSCLGNPMDRGAWRATFHKVPKSWTRLKQLSMHTCIADLQYCVSRVQQVHDSFHLWFSVGLVFVEIYRLHIRTWSCHWRPLYRPENRLGHPPMRWSCRISKLPSPKRRLFRF